MNIVIVGQGAIGLLWYHQLVKGTNNTVSLLCSARITSPPEHSYFTDIDNHTEKASVVLASNSAVGDAELILFCVKAYHIESALLRLINHINSCASIIFCHNGMGEFNFLSSLKQPCYTLLTTHGVKIVNPFHAQHTGIGHNDLGLINGKIEIEKQNSLFTTLAQALPSLFLSNDIKEKQWLKLAINCVINPITALNNIDNGDMLSDKYTVQVDQLLKEIVSVALSEKVIFDFKELKNQVLNVATKTAKNCSSMRSDILQQRRTEIDFINGYVVSVAKKAGMPVPENETLLRKIKALELKY